jgi:long-chain fatty acid transport protein
MIKLLRLALCLTLLLTATSTLATNAYFSHSYSIKEKGLAGAGAALGQDSLSAATNNAGMAFIDESQFDFGLSWFIPKRSYQSSGTPSGFFDPNSGQASFSIGPQGIDSKNENFFIPAFGIHKRLNQKSALTLSVYGNGGLNTEYKGGSATVFGGFDPNTGAPLFFDLPGTYGAGRTGVDLMQLGTLLTYSYRVNQNHGLGISGIFVYQRFKAEGLGNFAPFSLNPLDLTNNDYDDSTGFGLRLGWQGQLTPTLRVGLSYQSKINMTRFKKYQGLFANGGDFDIPPVFNAGIAVSINPRSTLFIDIQGIYYNEVKSVSNPITPLFSGCQPANPFAGTPAAGSGCLGGSNGPGFGWDDVLVYKLGYQWQPSDKWTYRLGFSYAEQPINKSEVLFNILAPATVETHYTFGFTRRLGKKSAIDFSLLYAQGKGITGINPLDPAQRITIKMKDQLEFGLGFSREF